MTFQLMNIVGSPGTAVPYSRQHTNVSAAVAQNSEDSLRLKRYQEHWRFFQGIHWSFARENGEPLVSANYCRATVLKKASWLIGKGMLLDTPQALREVTLPVLVKTWQENNQDLKLLQMAIMGGVTGDVFILVTSRPPTVAERAANPNSKGSVKIRLLPSESVFPTWNELNMEELQSVKIVTEVYDKRPDTWIQGGRPSTNANDIQSVKKRKYVEIITATDISEGYEGEPPLVRKNDLGEIPFIAIANETFPGEFYGLSDLDGLIDLQREMNEKMTDISDIVNYHAAPITIITGAKAANLDRGVKNMWSGLPADAKVFNLQLNSDLPASYKYLELLRQMFFDIANLPEGSLGRLQPISNTSAAALEVQFQPLIECTARKAAAYIAGIKRINYFILRIDQLLHKKQYPADLCGHCGGRIVTFRTMGRDGQERLKQKCYLIDPQTLDFLHPDEVKVNVTVEHSFGNEVRLMPYGQVKKMWDKKSTSYWDPEPMVDKQAEAEERDRIQKEQVAEQAEQMKGQQDDEHARALELKTAKPPEAPKPAVAPKGEK